MDHRYYQAYAKKLNELHCNLSNKESDWSGIAFKLSKKKKRRKNIIYFWTTLLGLLIIIVAINKLSIKRATKPGIPNIENKQIVSLLSQKSLDSNCLIISEANPHVNSISRRYNLSLNSLPAVGFQNLSKHRFVEINRNVENNEGIKFNSKKEECIENTSNSIFGTELLKVEIIAETKHQQGNIDQLPMVRPNLKIQSLGDSLLDFISHPKLIKAKVSNKFYLRFFAGPLYINHRFAFHNLDLTIAPEKILKINLGHQMGIFLNYQKHDKLRFGGGLQYNYTSFITGHNLHLTAESLSQTGSNNGINKYEFTYKIYDGSNKSTVNLSLFEVDQNQTINHNDSFDLNMSVKRKTYNFLMPLFVERKIFGNSKMKVYGKIGSNLKLYSFVTNTLKHQAESCKELCFVNGFEPQIISEVGNKFTFSGVMGLNFEFKIKPKTIVGIAPELVISPLQNYSAWHPQYGINAFVSYQITKK
jgi:hypothetical protein